MALCTFHVFVVQCPCDEQMSGQRAFSAIVHIRLLQGKVTRALIDGKPLPGYCTELRKGAAPHDREGQ